MFAERAASGTVEALGDGSSLIQLLARKRGVRNPMRLPPLTEPQVVAWAECHRARTGAWPRNNDGPVADAPGETWAGVNYALTYGKRGLPGGSSLAKLGAPPRRDGVHPALADLDPGLAHPLRPVHQ